MGVTEDPPRLELTKSSWFAVSIISQAFQAPWVPLEESLALEPPGSWRGGGAGTGGWRVNSELPQAHRLVRSLSGLVDLGTFQSRQGGHVGRCSSPKGHSLWGWEGSWSVLSSSSRTEWPDWVALGWGCKGSRRKVGRAGTRCKSPWTWEQRCGVTQDPSGPLLTSGLPALFWPQFKFRLLRSHAAQS